MLAWNPARSGRFCMIVFAILILGYARLSTTGGPAPSAVLAAPARSPAVQGASPEPTTAPGATASELTGAPLQTASARALAATLLAELPATRTPDPALPSAEGWNAGIGEIQVTALDEPVGEQPLWLVHSAGQRHRSLDAQDHQDHFVALYARTGDTWRAVDRVALTCPDRLDRVQQVAVAPERTWILAQGGANAHNGCFDLLSFDGKTLRSEIAHRSSGPDRSRLEDLNGDGTPDVVLDTSDPYVLCYGCNLRLESFDVRQWDGQQFTPVRLQMLPSSVPERVRVPINQAVAWAQAGLWKSAGIILRRASAAYTDHPAAVWDVELIKLHAAARAAHARRSAYPLLAQVFYGDYTSAVATMRRHGAEALFGAQPPLVTGTPAQGWEANLVDWIERSTTPAIADQPDLAAAYFIRGWARHIGNPIDSNALRDIQRAADFAPDEPLYAESATILALERRFLDSLRRGSGDS